MCPQTAERTGSGKPAQFIQVSKVLTTLNVYCRVEQLPTLFPVSGVAMSEL